MEDEDFRSIITILLEIIHDSSHDPQRVYHLSNLALFVAAYSEDKK